MAIQSLADALEREHHDIDEGIDAYAAGPVRAERDPAPLRRAIHALRRHIYLEEEFLFPPLRAAGLVPPVFVMLREHGQIWTILDEVERSLATDSDVRATLTLCHQLTVALQHHNLKEERILYPQADEVLTGPADEQLRAFIESGRLPEGWVCQKARVSGPGL